MNLPPNLNRCLIKALTWTSSSPGTWRCCCQGGGGAQGGRWLGFSKCHSYCQSGTRPEPSPRKSAGGGGQVRVTSKSYVRTCVSPVFSGNLKWTSVWAAVSFWSETTSNNDELNQWVPKIFTSRTLKLTQIGGLDVDRILSQGSRSDQITIVRIF